MTAAKDKTRAKSADPEAGKRGVGRPAHIPTPSSRQLCLALAVNNVKQARIAEHLKISLQTLEKHYARELKLGVEQVCAIVGTSMYRIAATGNSPAAVMAGRYILGCKGGWKEVARLEIDARGAGLPGLLARVIAADDAVDAETAESEPPHLDS